MMGYLMQDNAIWLSARRQSGGFKILNFTV